MVLPSCDALAVEVFFASAAVLEGLVLLVHFCEADGAVGIVLEVDLLGIFRLLRFHSAFESICELLIEDGVGSFGDSGIAFEIIEYFIVLCDLGDDEVDVFARFVFEAEVVASAFD